MSIINSLKHNKVVFDGLQELLLILEVSQLLQFTSIIFETIKVIKEKYLFTIYAINIFPVVSKLDMLDIVEKAHAYILYNFKAILEHNKVGFLELNVGDLQSLLNSNSLNVDNEIDVYDLIIDWSSVNSHYNFEYEMAAWCVHFNSMNKEQLQYCISKTNNLCLQNTIILYITYTEENRDTIGLFTRPARSIPYVLCAIQHKQNDHAFMYCWDWNNMQFKKFLKLDPLPPNTNGYNVIIKGN